MINFDLRLRLRPNVAFIPQDEDRFDFFQSNSRRNYHYRLIEPIADLIKTLDGSRTVNQICTDHQLSLEKVTAVLKHLRDKCLVEDAEIGKVIAKSPWRRVLNFLGDYFPDTEIEEQFRKIQDTSVVILGIGAVGSWIAIQLAKSGFRQFILVDQDDVEISNLNRSLYWQADVGRSKLSALTTTLHSISKEIVIDGVSATVANSEELVKILADYSEGSIVINCADYPSVDDTSAIVDEACKVLDLPYIIGGGYNLHLSLIGMTVIPGKTSCYHCGRITLDERQKGDLENLKKLDRPWRNIGNLAPLAAITSSFAANEAIRLALCSQRLMPVMINRRGEFNFLTNKLSFIDLPPRPECGCLRG